MSDNPEILIIQNLKIAIPRVDILLFYQTKVSSVKQTYLRDMFKRPPRVSLHQLLWYILASCLLFHQLLQQWWLQKIHKEDTNDLEPAGERDIQVEYSW